jgi:hypothetical protein
VLPDPCPKSADPITRHGGIFYACHRVSQSAATLSHGNGLIIASCLRAHFCSRQTGLFLDRKQARYLAPETLKETHALPMSTKEQKGSNFIELYKNRGHQTEPELMQQEGCLS